LPSRPSPTLPAAKRRQPFNQMGIFRHYPELDAPAPRTRRAKRQRV